LAFTDLEKAYDNINRQEIWKVLHRANLSKGLRERKEHLCQTRKNIMDSKNLKVSKCLEGLDREEFHILCYSTRQQMRYEKE
jgi:hypothetical protein